MAGLGGISGLQKTTDYKVVLPFYSYAALGILTAMILLLLNTKVFGVHYFYPHTLALTHTMALAWGTMIIFGASYQLLPVLIEGEIASNLLGHLTFAFAAVGIPILIYGFYVFNTGWPLRTGATLINIAVVCYLINVWISGYRSDKKSVHAWFIITAAIWLFTTTFFGLLLVWNFQSQAIFTQGSVAYLSLHAHLGLIGWFLMMVLGVGSRLIPMFLISKYKNDQILWYVYYLVNLCLLSFVPIWIWGKVNALFFIPLLIGLSAVGLFAWFIYKSYKVRIRKNVDNQMKSSLLAVSLMLVPILIMTLILAFLKADEHPNIALLYGFCILFGWITAIALGMTYKTLPFIVWNLHYKGKGHKGGTPAPKELFSEKLFKIMLIAYIAGFVIFAAGIIFKIDFILKFGAVALLAAAIIYVINTGKIILHQPKKV